ncbi:Small Conductance Mechanosensitive Ion channel [Ectocarpus siliculosus]|uniref:Small Conductance Mechanosensitive Ion channel n=1 Tax=Ectocarpus siliculosus TaxID=2880 RepID=D7FX37_ECTSI|nr:Small Conductance Mechanosensitive Ion channel [Ectocarpus siliculosus]|eukprot:CBJ26370.1 Small Conductance Mechanosensitive Ion channel [Ectocarpus siliculosus]
MNPWNEDRLREDSDPEDEPASGPITTTDSPRRRRSSLGSRTPNDLPGLEVPPSPAGGNAGNLPSNRSTFSPGASPPTSSGTRFGRRRSIGAISLRGPSRADGAQMADARAAAEATARNKLEQEAPIRGLAKQMSRMDMFSGTKKSGGAGTNSRPGHKKNSSGMGFLLSSAQPHSRVPSRTDDRSPWEVASIATAAPPPLPRPTGAGVAQTPVAVTSTTAGRQQRGNQVQPDGNVSPGRLERATGGGGGEYGVDGCRNASKTPAGVAVTHGVGHSGGAGASRPPPQDDVNYPDTPPPLRRMQRRGSLVNREVPQEDEPKEPIEPELMIGEIQSIRLHEEIALVRRAIVLIMLSLVAAVLVRAFAGEFYYFVVALHYDIAVTIWSVVAMYIWRELFHQWVYTDDSKLARAIFRHVNPALECHLALRVGILLKNYLVLLVATSYLWRPYLQRVQSSILAQYILLLLTDYCTKGYCNPGDQNFAIEMGRQGIKEGKNISLYAVSKAMGFIPRNKLGHTFFRQLAGSNTLDSSKDATTLGNFLFDQLIIRSRPPPARPTTNTSPPRKSLAAAFTAAGGGSIRMSRGSHAGAGTYRALPRFGGQMQKRNSEPMAVPASPRTTVASPKRFSMFEAGRPQVEGMPLANGGGGGAAAGKVPVAKAVSSKASSTLSKLVPVAGRAALVSSGRGGAGGGTESSDARCDDVGTTSSANTSPGRSRVRRRKAGTCVDGVDLSIEVASGGETEATGDTGTEGESPEQPVASKSPSGRDTRIDRARILAQNRSVFTSCSSVASSSNYGDKECGDGVDGEGRQKDQEDTVKGQAARSGETKAEKKEKPKQEEVLVRTTFCPALEPELLDVAFKIFDLDNSGTVTKEEMVLGVVGTFKDHRSLAHTLQDSEHIAQKLGLIIMCVILFILFFVWLSIWGADVVSLSVTFASFLIAFSFMIGTAASNLMSAVLFIFVSRLYDVGDRVHIYSGSNTQGEEPTNVTVVKVDLMTTVFKRWDEQVFYMPNHLLATKTIVNIQRTAHQWHEFMIQVAATTTPEKLTALQTSLQEFSKSKDKPEGLYTRMGFSLVRIEDSTKLTIRITFRQRGNWQNMEKKWACQSMCTWAIKSACDSLNISYFLPEVPVQMKKKSA